MSENQSCEEGSRFLRERQDPFVKISLPFPRVTNLSRHRPLVYTCYHDPPVPVEVKFSFGRPADHVSQKRLNRQLLPGADFQRDDALRRQQITQTRDYGPIRRQAVLAAIERKERIVIANLRRKADKFTLRNIWRIGNNHIKTAAQCIGPIAADDVRTLS